MLVFKLVAEMGSVRRAADSLGLTQPALSKAIRRLELHFSLTLFERTPRGVLLTSAGDSLYAGALALSDWSNELRNQMASVSAAGRGVLRVGVVPALIEPVMVPASKALLHAPHRHLQIRAQLSGELFRLLQNGEIDMAIAAIDKDQNDGFAHLVLGQQKSYVVSRKRHILQRRPFDLDELGQQEWVLPPPNILLRRWADALLHKAHRPAASPAVEIDASPAIFAPLIRFSDMLTVMTSDTIASPLGLGLAALPYPAPVWSLDIGLFWRRSTPFSQLMEEFRTAAEAAFSQRPN